MAREVAEGMVSDLGKAVEKLESSPVKGGGTVSEKIQAQRERKSEIESARGRLASWQMIAMQGQRQQAETAQVAEAEAAVEAEQVQPSPGVASEVRAEGGYKLSDEVDENGRQFVLNSDGNVVFGEIGDETGLSAAPILLSEGIITNRSTNDGYGLVHIEARHGEQIRNAGYDSVVDFIEEVAKNWEVIKEGNDRAGNKTYMLQLTDKHNNTLMVELSSDGTYWNINTAGIFKTSYGRNRKEVYNRHTTAKQSTETVEALQDVEQSGTQSSSGMVAPTTSESEVSENVSDGQVSEVESSDIAEISESEADGGKGFAEVLADVARGYAGELGVEVDVFATAEDAVAQGAIGSAGRGEKGWFDTRTGRVGIIAGNHDSAEDVRASIRHEVVAHKSLRDMLGMDAYGDLCLRVWNEVMDGGARERKARYAWETMSAKRRERVLPGGAGYSWGELTLKERGTVMADGYVQEVAGDEFMADMAESGDYNDRSMWQKVVDFIREALHRLGFGEIGESDIRAMLARSEAGLRRGGSVGADSIISAMKANAIAVPHVEISDETWRDNVDTPIGVIKMGENQKTKLFKKGRTEQYGMLLETLSNPDIILEEKDRVSDETHERPTSYLFIKTFQKEDGSKYVNFESVTVSRDGLEVSISSHIIRENQLRNKIKSDRLLYKATALDRSANLSAEQPANEGGSLSSSDKVSEKVSDEQVSEGEKRFRIEHPVEETRDLIALHNLSEDKLRQALELGGFPMPSIAITKVGMAYTDFGDISLLFGKESIDPVNKQNKVYSHDAWTPTFPTVGYKLNSAKTRDIYRRANNVGSLPLFKAVYFHPDNYEGRIDMRGTASIVENFKDNYAAKQMFLSEKGNPVEHFETHEVEKYSTDRIKFLDNILDKIGLERLKNENDDTLFEVLKQLIGQYYDIDLDSMKPFLVKAEVRGAIRDAVDYADNGNMKTEMDVEPTKQKIDSRIDVAEFQGWLQQLFEGVVEKRGIRNERDMFTPSGSSRKWEELYDAVTLDNVVSAMKIQAKKGGAGLFGGSIFGASAKELADIEEIRNISHHIQSVPEDEYQAEKIRILTRLGKVSVPSVAKNISASMDFVEDVKDAVAKSHSAKGIYNYLRNHYSDMTMEVAEEIADIVRDIQNMNTRYLEAKPYRAIGFDEVKAAIIPSDTKSDIIQQLKDKGVQVRTYERGDMEHRRQVVNEASQEEDVRFRGGDGWDYSRNMSNNAVRARAKGLMTSEEFMDAYDMPGSVFDLLKNVGAIRERGWHHVGDNYTPTPFFAWSDGMARSYKAHKDELDALGEQWSKDRFNRDIVEEATNVIGFDLGIQREIGKKKREAKKRYDESLSAQTPEIANLVRESLDATDDLERFKELRGRIAELVDANRASARKVYEDELRAIDDEYFGEGDVRMRVDESIEDVNVRFNAEVNRYENGEMGNNEMFHLGKPNGIMELFLPNLPIVMRPRIINKASNTKHNVDIKSLRNLPSMISSPIFVFKRSDKALDILTEIKDRDGKNVCVAIEMNKSIQNGSEVLEVNDVRSIHGRDTENLIKPIVYNNTLVYVDKKKGLEWLSSASSNYQQEIDIQDLNSVANIVENFENPTIGEEKNDDIRKRAVVDGGDAKPVRRGGESLMDYAERVAAWDYAMGEERERDELERRYRESVSVRKAYDREIGRSMYQITEAFQDSMRSLRVMMDKILKANGRNEAGYFEDAYIAENAMSSATKAQVDLYKTQFIRPLLDAIGVLYQGDRATAKSFKEYIIAKHGLERNAYMRRQEAEQLAQERAKSEGGDASDYVDEYLLKLSDKDYSGLTGLFETDDVKEAEQKAEATVAVFEGYFQGDEINRFWDRVNAATNETLRKLRDSGVISAKQYDKVSTMYEHYIPLRGWEDETSDEVYGYMNEADSRLGGSVMKTAKGRASVADDPIATIALMAEDAIRQGNRNLMKQKFLNFVLNNPSDLVSVSDLWLAYNDVTGKWEPVFADLAEGDSAEEIEQKLSAKGIPNNSAIFNIKTILRIY